MDDAEIQNILLCNVTRADVYAKANSAFKTISGVLSIDTHGSPIVAGCYLADKLNKVSRFQRSEKERLA